MFLPSWRVYNLIIPKRPVMNTTNHLGLFIHYSHWSVNVNNNQRLIKHLSLRINFYYHSSSPCKVFTKDHLVIQITKESLQLFFKDSWWHFHWQTNDSQLSNLYPLGIGLWQSLVSFTWNEFHIVKTPRWPAGPRAAKHIMIQGHLPELNTTKVILLG